MKSVLAAVVCLICILEARAKIYERCELARELRDVHGAPGDQIATWVCIAQHESSFDTHAVGHLNPDGSLDHGLFQISDLFWCSPPGNGHGCGLTCAALEDDYIGDDFNCARTIYNEHQQLTGNGFSAWSVYYPYCAGDVSQYVSGCFRSHEFSGNVGISKDPVSQSIKED